MKKWMLGIWVVVTLLSSHGLAQESGESEPKPIAGYDKGFFIQNPDGDFKLNIKTKISPTYFFQKGKSSCLPKKQYECDTANTFRVRTARLKLTGTFAKDWGFTFLIQNNTSNKVTGDSIPGFNWGAEVTYSPSDYFNLALGIETPLFDRYNQTGNALFADAPLVITQRYALGIQELSVSRPAFGPSEAPGLVISGSISDKFQYGIGITNGSNPDGTQNYYSNFNKMFSGAARIQYSILKDPGADQSDLAWSESPALAVGAGASYEDMGSGDTSTGDPDATPPIPPTIYLRRSIQGTGDLTFKYKGLSLIGAWYGRIIYARTIATGGNFTLQDQGFLAQAGYFVIPKKLELAARASFIAREGPHNDSSDYYGGINWYIYGTNIKWMNNVGLVRSYDTVDGTNGERIWRVWSMLVFDI